MSKPLAIPPPQTLSVPRSRGLSLLGRSFEWKHVILTVVVGILVYQVIVPLAFLLWGSLKASSPIDADYFSLNLTLANYQEAISGRTFWQALGNTFLYAIGSTALAAVFGATLALITSRTNAPLGRFISALAYIRIIIPGFLTAIAWILLGSPEIGLINRAFKDVTGFGPLFNVYTLPGMIWVQALDAFPLIYVTMSAALKSMDPSLEEAAFTSGKSVVDTLRSITFPLVIPALVASSLLIFIYSVESFEVPLAIGLPYGIYVLSTQIFFGTTHVPVDYGLSGAYGVMLLLLSLTCVFVYQYLTRRSYRYVTVTGKAFRPRTISLGRWRWAATGLGLLVMLFAVILPSLVLLWSSLTPYIVAPTLDTLATANLGNYRDLSTNSLVPQSIRNSLVLAVSAATLVVLLVSIIAWMVYRTTIPGRRALDMLVFTPQSVPALLLAVAMLWLYLVLPLPVYGTLWIILLAYLTRYLPVAMRIISAGVVQINKELEEAAYVAGAGWVRMFAEVLTPLMRPVLVTAWVWIVIHAFRDVSISVILAGPGTQTVGLALYSLLRGGYFGIICAFSVLLLVLLLVIAYLAEQVGRRFGVSGIG